jgi:hypothetical protein
MDSLNAAKVSVKHQSINQSIEIQRMVLNLFFYILHLGNYREPQKT